MDNRLYVLVLHADDSLTGSAPTAKLQLEVHKSAGKTSRKNHIVYRCIYQPLSAVLWSESYTRARLLFCSLANGLLRHTQLPRPCYDHAVYRPPSGRVNGVKVKLQVRMVWGNEKLNIILSPCDCFVVFVVLQFNSENVWLNKILLKPTAETIYISQKWFG